MSGVESHSRTMRGRDGIQIRYGLKHRIRHQRAIEQVATVPKSPTD